jgi:hypothetical protein
MKRKAILILSLLLLTMVMAIPAFARGSGKPHPQPIIYVTGQGLAYESIVTADPVPMRGRFQKLEAGGPTKLKTEFGPGDHGYVGGRWWVDTNNDGEMDPDDLFFVCPLRGPGFVPSSS